jgi:hypothetical protein
MTQQISNFYGQIQNLLKNAVRMIYRLSLLGKGHISAMWLEIARNAILITSNDIQIILFCGPQSSPKW